MVLARSNECNKPRLVRAGAVRYPKNDAGSPESKTSSSDGKVSVEGELGFQRESTKSELQGLIFIGGFALSRSLHSLWPILSTNRNQIMKTRIE
jgi:hypothetical protein